MSTMGILAKGMAGALKGGDVLAKGEEDKRKMMWWDHKTETTRKNNMDSMFTKHKLDTNTNNVDKDGSPINKYDWNKHENRARKEGLDITEHGGIAYPDFEVSSYAQQ